MKTITKDMIISEALAVDSGLAQILMEYGMSCFGCPSAGSKTLEMGCASHGANVDEMVTKMNEYLASK